MSLRWFHRRAVRIVAGVLLAGFLALNLVAFLHARAMSRFNSAGERTASPEQLSAAQKAWVLLTGVKLPKPVNARTPRDAGLEFETLTFAGAHGLTLEAWRVRRTESRGVVVLFHGYSTGKDTLLGAAKEFHALGWETLLVDFHGSGGSAGSETSVGWHEAADVAAAFAAAKKSAAGRPVILYGVSMGAAAVLRAIHALGVQPEAVVLECPFARLLSTAANRFHTMRLPAFPLAHLLVFWGGAQQGYNGFAHNPADYARSVRCPALVLHGAADARVSVAQLQRVADSLAGPKRVQIFPGVGHQSYVAARPDEWRAAVGGFLNGLGRLTPAREAE